ncbi:hypothetical protein [Micromonospora sonneratiae]|uniref:FG-GAP repeat-containing protein n=1 Tax=Micromonospora sonneratiae TaxID=1184706 RepID=A0ABW3YE95_9ACTN
MTDRAAAQAQAARAARTSGERVRVDSMTDETTEVWALPEGGFEATLSLGPVRVKHGDGWVPVDVSLVKDQATGAVRTVADTQNVQLSAARPAGLHELAGIGVGDDRLSLGWDGALPEPVLEGNKATYVEAKPGVDLVVEVSRGGVETFLVVKSPAAANQVHDLVFPVTGPNVAAFQRDAFGNTTIADGAGRGLATVPAPEMWDAARTPAGDPARVAVVASEVTGRRQEVAGVGLSSSVPGLDFRLTPDMAWMTDAATAWPVVIDPQINPMHAAYDIYVKENDTTHNGGNNDIQLGQLPDGKTRGLARWDTTVLVGTQISSATFYFWNFWSGACTGKLWELWSTGSIPNNVLWTNQPSWNYLEATSTATLGGTGCSDGQVSIDGKNFLQRAATAGDASANMGLRVPAATEGDGTFFKQFRSADYTNATQVPYAVVDYNSYPTVGERSTSPVTACVTGPARPMINTLTPQLSSVIADVDTGAVIKAEFEWWAVGGAAKIGSSVTGTGASGATFSTTVPAGAFAEGGSYQWRVRGNDGSLNGSWSSFCEFTTMLLDPPAAGCPATLTAGDFNGDGVRDRVIADPKATVGSFINAGVVYLLDGATGAQRTLQQGLDGMPDTPETNDRFGWALSVFDANRDGCADLAIGAPYEDVGTTTDAGAVYLVYGSPLGLGKGPAALTIQQGAALPNGRGTVPDTVEASDWFGFSLVGGTTAAGEPFLMVGAPGEDLSNGYDAGTAHYLRGSVNVKFDGQSPQGIEQDDRQGFAVAASPYHLAIAAPGEKAGPQTEQSGAVCVLNHNSGAGAPAGIRCFIQGDGTTSDTAERGDWFGKSVSMVAYRPVGAPAGVANSLLAVGAPGEDLGSVRDTGLVHQFLVTTTSGTQLAALAQDSSGIGGTKQTGDLWGERVVLVNRDPSAQTSASTVLIAVGTPGRNVAGAADFGTIQVFAAGVDTIASGTTVERGSGLPGSAMKQELIGAWMTSDGSNLLVASPYGDRAVYALAWADLAAGSAVPAVTYVPGQGGIPSDAISFGLAVG